MKKITKLLTVIIFIIITTFALSITASAEKKYGDFSYEISGGNITITKYNGNDNYVYIPDQIEDKDVTIIGDSAFANNQQLTNIRLPNKLSTIGDHAFEDCGNLKRIVFPNSLTRIGLVGYGYEPWIFKGATSLDTIVVGDNISIVPNIDFVHEYSYNGLSSLNVLSLPSARIDIADEAYPALSDIYFRSEAYSSIAQPYWRKMVCHFISQEAYNNSSQPETYEIAPLSDSHARVKFNGNGGQIPDINGKLHNSTEIWTLLGQPVSEEIRPIKADYEFVGWYDNKACTGEPWDFVFDEVTKNTTLYAKWRPEQYTVTFDAQGGKCTTKTKDYSFGLAMEELPTPTRSNYLFAGWYTRANASGELYLEDTLMPKSNVKLYAAWIQKGKSLIVTFDPNGGTCDTSKALVEYGKTIELPKPTRKGHKFLGWNTSSDGKGQYFTDSTEIKYTNVNLYAVWKINNYKLTYNANGGNVSKTSKTVQYNTTIGTLPIPVRDGYEFIGWFYSNGNQAKSSDRMSAGNRTLTAKWRGFEYMILFDAKGGKLSASDTKFVCCGDKLGTLPTPTAKGYAFMGWYTQPKMKGVKYTSSSEMPEKDITLYAGWKKLGYATSIKLNKTNLTLGVGQTYNLKATTTPTTTLDKLTWNSSNTKIITVNSNGKITAKATGKATITVTTSKGYTATVNVTVKKAVTKIKVPYTSRSLNVGQKIKITPTSVGYAGVVTWSSSNTSVAKVDKNGNITAIAKGKSKITIKAYNGVTATITITVK